MRVKWVYRTSARQAKGIKQCFQRKSCDDDSWKIVDDK